MQTDSIEQLKTEVASVAKEIKDELVDNQLEGVLKEIEYRIKEGGKIAFDVATLLALTNKTKYNYLKLAEELAELLEVVIKFATKVKEKRPPKEKLVEELGDVMFRILVLAAAKGEEFGEDSNLRVEEKALKLYNYYKEGKYVGGI